MAKSIKDVLDQIKDKSENQENVSIDELVTVINSFGYDISIFILALFITLPTGAIPGFPAFFSLLIIAFSIRKMMGINKIWAPSFLKEKTISSQKINRSIEFIEPKLEALKKYIKPRMTLLDGRLLNYAVPVFIILAALTIPILGFVPMLASIPSIAICLLAISRFRKDGLMFLVGLVTAIGSFFAIPWGIAVISQLFG